MKHAVFDCDDVLANLRDLVVLEVSKRLNRPVSLSEFVHFDVSKIYGDAFDITDMFRSIPLEALPAEPSTTTLTVLLKLYGWKTTVVTARGYHDDAHLRTVNWLRKNNIYIDDVIVVPLNGDKKQVLANLGEIDFYVEDNHDHVEKAHSLSNVKRVFLMDRPWNKDGLCGTRVKNIKEVLSIVYNENIL